MKTKINIFVLLSFLNCTSTLFSMSNRSFDQKLLDILTQEAPDKFQQLISLDKALFAENFPQKILLVGETGVGKKVIAKCLASRYNLMVELFHHSLMTDNEIQEKVYTSYNNAQDYLFLVPWIHGRSSIAKYFFKDNPLPHKIIATTHAIDDVPQDMQNQFNYIFHIEKPSQAARREILNYYIQKSGKQLSENLLNLAAAKTESCSFRKLDHFVHDINRSYLMRHYESNNNNDSGIFTKEDVDYAIENKKEIDRILKQSDSNKFFNFRCLIHGCIKLVPIAPYAYVFYKVISLIRQDLRINNNTTK